LRKSRRSLRQGTHGRQQSSPAAGHPPLLLWRSATRKVESIEQNGLFLGPFPQAEYSEVCSRYDSGDLCLLYTDGVLEATNNKDEEFGSERLSEFLAKAPDCRQTRLVAHWLTK
jgi:serine phosphatase RsbU (regulator of sigma subunit)